MKVEIRKSESNKLNFSSEAILKGETSLDLLDWGDFEVQTIEIVQKPYRAMATGIWEIHGMTFVDSELFFNLDSECPEGMQALEYAEDMLYLWRDDDFQIEPGKLVALDLEIVEEAKKEIKECELEEYLGDYHG